MGEAKNSWLTGTSAWNYVAISQAILGIKPDYDGLCVDPCIPADWDGYTVSRIFRGVGYIIHVTNPNGVQKGVSTITVDGMPISGNVLPLFAPGDVHNVEVVMG